MKHSELLQKINNLHLTLDWCNDCPEYQKIEVLTSEFTKQLKKEQEEIKTGILKEPEKIIIHKDYHLLLDLCEVLELFEGQKEEYEDSESYVYDHYKDCLYYNDWTIESEALKDYFRDKFPHIDTESGLYFDIESDIEDNKDYYTEESTTSGYAAESYSLCGINIDEVEDSLDWFFDKLEDDYPYFSKLESRLQESLLETILNQSDFTLSNNYIYYYANINFHLVPDFANISELVEEKQKEIAESE